MKKYEVEINGEVYQVAVRELADDAEMTPPTPEKANNPEPAPTPTPTPAINSVANGDGVHAPMPGTILRIVVTPGQTVAKGDTLIVLEAMKMENEIVAPADGVVNDILVQTNDRVQSDQLLLTL